MIIRAALGIFIILLTGFFLRKTPGRICWLYAVGFAVGFACSLILFYKP